MLAETSNLPVKAAAQRLGVSVSKLYQLAAARQIGHYRIGGKILFSQQDIEAFLTGCRVGIKTPDTIAPAPRLRLKHISLNRGS